MVSQRRCAFLFPDLEWTCDGIESCFVDRARRHEPYYCRTSDSHNCRSLRFIQSYRLVWCGLVSCYELLNVGTQQVSSSALEMIPDRTLKPSIRMSVQPNLSVVYFISVICFCMGQAVCGTTKGSITLIVGRAIAGLGAGGILKSARAFFALTSHPQRTQLYLATTSVSILWAIFWLLGPIIGGRLAHLDWRWCCEFYEPGVQIFVLIQKCSLYPALIGWHSHNIVRPTVRLD